MCLTQTCHMQLEKYRPSKVADIVGNVDAVSRLKIISEQGNMPNLILAGPPGTGKTTSILAMARGLLGPAVMKEAVLELNASDDRGIDVVRNRIKMFAQKKVTLPPGRHKIVLLDEADRCSKAIMYSGRRNTQLLCTVAMCSRVSWMRFTCILTCIHTEAMRIAHVSGP
jgi:replication factor C subunit 2/4